jgi:hypothetical protein
VPLTIIGDRTIKGYDPAALTEALKALDAPADSDAQS